MPDPNTLIGTDNASGYPVEFWSKTPKDYQVDIPPELLDEQPDSGTGVPLDKWDLFGYKIYEYFAALAKKNPGQAVALLKERDTAIEQLNAFREYGVPMDAHPLYEKVKDIPEGELTRQFRSQAEQKARAKTAKLQMLISSPEGRRNLELAIQNGDITEADATVNNPFYHQAVQEAQNAYAEKQTKLKESLLSGVYSNVGRQKLAQAVQSGLLTEDEATTNNPYWQDYQDQVRQKEIAAAPEQALATQKQLREQWAADQRYKQEAAKASTPVERGMAANAVRPVEWNEQGQALDANGNPTGAGMSLEEAQAVFGQRPVTTGKSDAASTLENLIYEGRRQGIDTTQAEDTYRQLANSGTAGDQAMAYTSQALNAAIQQAKQGQRAKQTSFLQQQYPNEYKSWAEKTRAGYGNTAPQGWESGFADWVNGNTDNPTPEQTAFQQKRKDTELANWQKYGDIYGAYQEAQQNATAYTPIESWIENTPQVKVAWERRQPQVRRQPYAQWR